MMYVYEKKESSESSYWFHFIYVGVVLGSGLVSETRLRSISHSVLFEIAENKIWSNLSDADQTYYCITFWAYLVVLWVYGSMDSVLSCSLFSAYLDLGWYMHLVVNKYILESVYDTFSGDQ